MDLRDLPVASSGKFSSDRTIGEYAEGIWNAVPCPVVWTRKHIRSDHDSLGGTEKSTGEHGHDRILIDCLSLPFDCYDQRESRSSRSHGLPRGREF